MNDDHAPHPQPPFDDEVLAAFVDGTLDPSTRADVEAALTADPAFRRTAADLRAALDDAQALVEPVPVGLADRILAALPGDGPTERASMSHAPTSVSRFWPLAAAAVLLVSIGVLAFVTTSTSPQITLGPSSHPDVRTAGLPQADPAEVETFPQPHREAWAPFAGERYLAHVSVDKPIYRPGERVRARALVLEAFRRTPLKAPGGAVFELTSPKGETVLRQSAALPAGAAGFGWEIPADQPGGTYQLTARVNDCPPSTVTFDVHRFRAPRLKTDLEFVKKAYGAGDRVEATLDVRRAEGGIPAGAKVEAVARIGGSEVFRQALALDATGGCRVGFALPTELGDGEGTLALVITDGGVTETAARTIPIVMRRVDLAFLPEGGDLVAGVPCGLYFEARTPKQEPADVAGRIVDDQGTFITSFATIHEGRGRITFTPQAGRTYRAVVQAPKGIEAPVMLPEVKPAGISLRSQADAFLANQPIEVALAATHRQTAVVGLFVRERELARKAVRLRAGKPVRVSMPVADDLAGVLRVTVFAPDGTPQAERLIFRRPARAARVEVVPSTDRLNPGGHVELSVRTLDEFGRPVSALVALSATDDAVLTKPVKRERAARLMPQALLGCEVRELMDPAAYLTDDAQGFYNIDLLLGTQGWRRFAFEAKPAEALAKLGDEGARALAFHDKVPGEALDLALGFGGHSLSGVFADRIASWRKVHGRHLERRRGGAWFGADGNAVPERGAAPMPEDMAAPEAAPMAVGAPKKKDVRLEDRPRDDSGPVKADRAGGEGVLGAGDGGDAEQVPAPDDAAVPEEKVADAAAGDGGRNARRVPEFQEQPKAAEKEPEAEADDIPPMMDPVGRPMAARDELREVGGRAALRAFRIQGFSIDWPAGERAKPAPAWARVYRHQHAKANGGARRDFTETVYWNAGAWTDSNGMLRVSFDVADSITTVRVRADAATVMGGLGQAEAAIEVRRPLYVEPKFPLEVTAGDLVDLPLAITNGTAQPMTPRFEVVALEGFRQRADASPWPALAADSSARVVLPLEVGSFQGEGKIVVRVTDGTHTDLVRRSLRVVPRGFPIHQRMGGMLERRAVHTLEIPEDVDLSSIVTEGAVYPTPLASLQDALRGLLREPSGCFEQTSSSNYPNVMAMQYLASHEGADPVLMERTAGLLKRGYARLVSYECKEKGYEWFGGDPGHEALTAYGVLQFRDMAKVMQVDGAMLERTRKWLLGRRDGKGGFKRNPRALDSFGGAPAEITNAYILWALVESGEPGLEAEIAALEKRVKDSRDSYLVALGANILHLAGKRDLAQGLMQRLVDAQDKDGAVAKASTSITRSGGDALRIETTSLSVLAWLRAPKFTQATESAMRWLAGRCKGGRFGSTQSTVLALKAIVAYDESRATARKPGRLEVRVDGELLHQMAFEADATGPFVIPDLATKLGPGKHEVVIEMHGGVAMPYALTLQYHADTPSSAADAAVLVEADLSTARVTEGEPVDIPVRVRNRTKQGQPMTTAVVGLPGGVEVRMAQLKELVKEGQVDFVELRGREVVLYWRSLAPEAVHELRLSGVAAVPGTYTGPASRAYLYYTDEAKVWEEGLSIRIDPR